MASLGAGSSLLATLTGSLGLQIRQPCCNGEKKQPQAYLCASQGTVSSNYLERLLQPLSCEALESFCVLYGGHSPVQKASLLVLQTCVVGAGEAQLARVPTLGNATSCFSQVRGYLN